MTSKSSFKDAVNKIRQQNQVTNSSDGPTASQKQQEGITRPRESSPTKAFNTNKKTSKVSSIPANQNKINRLSQSKQDQVKGTATKS
jgi:hypothetical protein